MTSPINLQPNFALSSSHAGVPEHAFFSSSEASDSDYDGHVHFRHEQPDASVVYAKAPARNKSRTFSESTHGGRILRQQRGLDTDMGTRARRLSHDEKSAKPRKFLVDVEQTMKLVLEQEDTDKNFQIAATDKGPKVLSLGTAGSNGYNSFDIRGTYMLSNLLQELAHARDHGRTQIVLDEARLSENPVSRLSRMIRHSFWNNLQRKIDGNGLAAICADPKNRGKNQARRIYVPEEEVAMRHYYEKVSRERPDLGLIVDTIPKNFDARWVRSRNEFPGILALAMREIKRPGQESDFEGIPFVVPGARFNELYNWDSYFISLGLICDDKAELAQGIVEHFLFEIRHYGKILNGNRSYYLMRSQPPFLTDMIVQVYNELDPDDEEENKAWLKRAVQGAIQEYHNVWMSAPRLDAVTGLSRYRPDGLGIPPETEASHFTTILQPFSDALGISINEFTAKYNDEEIHEPKLDDYFLHDRALRESGHDTTYRFEKCCGNLGTIDLCSLLYKYETDIATIIRDHFDDELELVESFTLSPFPFGKEVPFNATYKLADMSGPRLSTQSKQTSTEWFARAARRQQLADYYLWHEGRGIYTDYDILHGKQSYYDTVTTFWAMWCGMASEAQAAKLMRSSLGKFEAAGGLLSGTEQSRGRITLDRPNRQWDYPAAWPPHQIMAWDGLEKYGYVEDAQRLAYRWLYMVTCGFVEAGGVVPEKFNAVEATANIDAEYGNQGTDFALVPKEGFGWTNASYQVGLQVLTPFQKRALGTLTPPETCFYPRRGVKDVGRPTNLGIDEAQAVAARLEIE